MAPMGIFQDGTEVHFSTDVKVNTEGVEPMPGTSVIVAKEGAKITVESKDIVAVSNFTKHLKGGAGTLVPSENGDVYLNGVLKPAGIVFMGWKSAEHRG